jgi:hypothetical protein
LAAESPGGQAIPAGLALALVSFPATAPLAMTSSAEIPAAALRWRHDKKADELTDKLRAMTPASAGRQLYPGFEQPGPII